MEETVEFDNMLGPSPERFIVWVEARVQNFVTDVIFPVGMKIVATKL